MTDVTNRIHYDIAITETENGWQVSGAIVQGYGAFQQHLGGLGRIMTYSTRKEAFEKAQEALATLGNVSVIGARK